MPVEKKVLIADGSDVDSDLLRIRFGNFHCETIEQSFTVQDAIERFRVLKPVLVMIDVGIPWSQDGPRLKIDELLPVIRDFSMTACVILMTREVDLRHLGKALGVGASGYIDKAILKLPEEFQVKVHTIFERYCLANELKKTADAPGVPEQVQGFFSKAQQALSAIIATQLHENARGDALVSILTKMQLRNTADEVAAELKYKEGVAAGLSIQTERAARERKKKLRRWGAFCASIWSFCVLCFDFGRGFLDHLKKH